MVNRDRETAAQNLYNDYFSENPTFGETMFRLRFRMSRSLFIRIVNAVQDHDGYFIQRMDVIKRRGLSTLQKVTTAFHILAYAVLADTTDEYIKIGESTAIECVKKFCRAIVEIFGERYLRSPTEEDVARLLYIGEQCGFPGSNNDINVLDSSSIFSNLAKGVAPPARYVIKEREYDMGYYLADSIYPKWATIVQTIHEPRGRKKKLFTQRQEACRKDVERAFGVLQNRFAIVTNPARFWSKEVLGDIMTACIIMHNMIIEDERDLDAPIIDHVESPAINIEIGDDDDSQFQEFLARFRKIKNRDAHFELRDALIDHIWELYSSDD